MEIIKVYRWCRRCERWRSLGNFSSSSRGVKGYTRRVCLRCIPPRSEGRHLTVRLVTKLTKKGRAYLAAERAA